jgi:hypothetical protein
VEFELPSVESQTLSARAEAEWRDSFVLALRFLYAEKHSQGALRAWLDSLEANYVFTNRLSSVRPSLAGNHKVDHARLAARNRHRSLPRLRFREERTTDLRLR